MSYRVVIHGIPSRESARQIAGALTAQTVAAAFLGNDSAATLTFTAEPDDVETAENDPDVDGFDAEVAAFVPAEDVAADLRN